MLRRDQTEQTVGVGAYDDRVTVEDAGPYRARLANEIRRELATAVRAEVAVAYDVDRGAGSRDAATAQAGLLLEEPNPTRGELSVVPYDERAVFVMPSLSPSVSATPQPQMPAAILLGSPAQPSLQSAVASPSASASAMPQPQLPGAVLPGSAGQPIHTVAGVVAIGVRKAWQADADLDDAGVRRAALAVLRAARRDRRGQLAAGPRATVGAVAAVDPIGP